LSNRFKTIGSPLKQPPQATDETKHATLSEDQQHTNSNPNLAPGQEKQLNDKSQSSHTAISLQSPDLFKFTFQTTPISQKYAIINTYPERRIINNEVPALTNRVSGTDFFKQPTRPSFIRGDESPHEMRFNPSESFVDYNTIKELTSRGRHAVDIGRVSFRDEDLIKKGGEAGRDLSVSQVPYYNPNKDAVMPGKQAINFGKANARTLAKSIYRKESSPDYYDTKKIFNGFNRLS